MDLSEGERTSLWTATSEAPPRPRLSGEQRCDVVVVGAGITGMTTALLLKRSGLRVIVLERGQVCEGVTGHTTAKVTSLHGLIYADLASSFGDDTARVFGEANEAAIAKVRALVAELGIDCGLESRAAYTYTTEENQLDSLRTEAETAQRIGLPATFTTETDLPFEVLGAVRFEDQAQFHPRRYVLGLAEAVDGDGSTVYQRSRVVDIRDGSPCRVETDTGGVVEAEHLVLATHLPLLDRGFFFAKAHPKRSYAMSVRVRGALTEGMYLSADEPTRSVRPFQVDGASGLIVGGESHKPGADPDEQRHWAALEEWAREHYDVERIDHRWSAQDYEPVDGLPYIGEAARTTRNTWVATGFRKWGMTGGTVAGMVLADLITGQGNPWAGIFDPNRVTPLASVKLFVSENLEVAKHFVADRLDTADASAIDALAPGEGVVARIAGDAYAVCRNDDGALCSVSPLCTHMGCHVRWNTAERSWDCPCHGSRFSPEGTVIQGPAVRDLDDKPLPEP